MLCAEGFSFLSSLFYLTFSRRDGLMQHFKHGTEKNNRRTKTKRKVLYLVMMLRDSLSFLAPSPASLPYQSLSLFHANARVEGPEV